MNAAIKVRLLDNMKGLKLSAMIGHLEEQLRQSQKLEAIGIKVKAIPPEIATVDKKKAAAG